MQEDMTAQAVFAPSPKQERNGKIEKNSKLADVPEEDSHCEDTPEPDVEAAEETTEPKKEIEEPSTAQVKDVRNDVPDSSENNVEKTEAVDCDPELQTSEVVIEINNSEPNVTEQCLEDQEQKSEL